MKKVRVGFIIIVVTILLLSCVSNADTSILKVSYSKSGKQGSTAKLNVYLQNTGTFESAITSIEGYVDIDNEVFEDLTVNSIESTNGKIQIGSNNNLDLVDLSGFSVSNSLSSISGDAGVFFNSNPISGQDNKIVIDFNTPIAEDTKLLTFDLVVKSDATPREYQNAIEITGFKAYFEDNTIRNIDPARLNFTVLEGAGESSSETTNNTIDNGVNNSVNNVVDNNAVVNNRIDNNVVNNAVNNVVNNSINEANNIVNNSVNNSVVNNNTNTNTTKNITNNSNTNSQSGKKDDPTTSNDNLPYTGIKTILIPLFILSAISYVIYKKYNKEKID